MNKKKHPLDWYIDNTPSDEKEYDKGCSISILIIAIIFFSLTVALLIVSKP